MILYILNLADLFSTVIALSHGLVEKNPVINFIMGVHPVLFPAVKLIPAYFLCMWLAGKARKRVYIAVCGVYAAVVIWNFINIAVFLAA